MAQRHTVMQMLEGALAFASRQRNFPMVLKADSPDSLSNETKAAEALCVKTNGMLLRRTQSARERAA